MRLAVTSDGVGRRRWRRSLVGGALVVFALAAVAAVGAGDAAARGTESWTRIVHVRLSPRQLGLSASVDVLERPTETTRGLSVSVAA